MQVPGEQRLFLEASRFRCCAVMAAASGSALPTVGTGTVLEHNGRLFVLTCQHVVSDFLTFGVGWISLFHPRLQIDRRDCHVVFADEKNDVAVLSIPAWVATKQPMLQPLILKDIGSRECFQRAVPGQPWSYVAVGFPAQLVVPDQVGMKLDLNPLALASGVVSRKGNRLTMDYRHGFLDGKMLDPRGMSGALFFEMHAEVRGEIWKPGVAVAMQHRWNEVSKTLLCSPVHQLRKVIAGWRGK